MDTKVLKDSSDTQAEPEDWVPKDNSDTPAEREDSELKVGWDKQVVPAD
jgi:hypothetical protein